MHTGAQLKPKYTGILQTLSTVVREEGARALWFGNGANCARIIPNYGTRVCVSS
jgi:hypothetical protein